MYIVYRISGLHTCVCIVCHIYSFRSNHLFESSAVIQWCTTSMQARYMCLISSLSRRYVITVCLHIIIASHHAAVSRHSCARSVSPHHCLSPHHHSLHISTIHHHSISSCRSIAAFLRARILLRVCGCVRVCVCACARARVCEQSPVNRVSKFEVSSCASGAGM